jgi:transposase
MSLHTTQHEDMPCVVIGVDVSKAGLDVGCSDGSWQAHFSNDKAGYKALIKEVCRRYGTVIIGLEPTGGYERGLIGACHDASIEVYFADARRVRSLAIAHNVGAKTDAIDARFIARFIEDVGGRKIVSRPSREALADIMSTRAYLVEERVRLEQVVTTLRSPQARRPMLRVIKRLQAEIKALDLLAHEHVQGDPVLQEQAKRLQTAPGVGPIVAYSLLAEVPELGDLTSKQIARLVGCAPKTQESGIWKGKAVCVGGRTRPRNMLYLAAMAAKRYNKSFKDFFETLTAAPKSKPKMVALMAIMRKIIIALNAMIRDQKDWQSA